MKTGIVFGATGLVGGYIVSQLLENDDYGKVKVFTRKPLGIDNPKLEEHIIDFKKLPDYEEDIKGHVVYCCVGTTIKKAKNEENYRMVDYDIPMDIAHIAERNEIDAYVVVSSIGANPDSNSFYLRLKAEMEESLQRQYSFKRLKIVRPSFLMGPRKEFRLGELLGKYMSAVISPLMMGKLKKYRPIHAAKVAKAMIKLEMDDSDQVIFESDELHELAR